MQAMTITSKIATTLQLTATATTFVFAFLGELLWPEEKMPIDNDHGQCNTIGISISTFKILRYPHNNMLLRY